MWKHLYSTVYCAVSCLLLLSLAGYSKQPITIAQSKLIHHFFVYGQQRADEDHKLKRRYAWNDYSRPLEANTSLKDARSLLLTYTRSFTNTDLQKKYLISFMNGYRSELLRITGQKLITKSPLIETFVYAIQIHAYRHDGMLPRYTNEHELYDQLIQEDPGLDPYAGIIRHYGVNTHLAGKHLDSIKEPKKVLLVWEIPSKPTAARWVAYADGSVILLSADQWILAFNRSNISNGRR